MPGLEVVTPILHRPEVSSESEDPQAEHTSIFSLRCRAGRLLPAHAARPATRQELGRTRRGFGRSSELSGMFLINRHSTLLPSSSPAPRSADLSSMECNAWMLRVRHKRRLHSHRAITIDREGESRSFAALRMTMWALGMTMKTVGMTMKVLRMTMWTLGRAVDFYRAVNMSIICLHQNTFCLHQYTLKSDISRKCTQGG